MGQQELESFQVAVVAKSDKAIRVSVDGEEVWVPVALIEDESDIGAHSEIGDCGEMVLPHWLAVEKDLL